jgi:predicted NUDIX family phosphoesterase
MTDQKLENILTRRDSFEIGSSQWKILNEEKADYLESIRPSTRERVVYFEEKFFDGIQENFLKDFSVYDLPFGIERRSALEYHPTRRHPIPYALIRFQDNYFFILRESGGGELRLIGKKGLAGGHVGEVDVVEGNLKKTFENSLMREAREEVGIVSEMVNSIDLRGFIKSDLGVDVDHLGLVYEIELSTEAIKSEEDGVLTGIWIKKEDLKNHYESFENWSKIVYDNLLK